MIRYIGVLAAIALLALGCQRSDNTVDEKTTSAALTAADRIRDGVFIHISHGSDDPHRVVMALRMATMMSSDKDVLVYCDIKGIEAVLKDSEDITYPTFPSAKESLAELLNKKVHIYACPGCMKAAGKTLKDLTPGVTLAEKEEFFGFTKGRILSLDY